MRSYLLERASRVAVGETQRYLGRYFEAHALEVYDDIGQRRAGGLKFGGTIVDDVHTRMAAITVLFGSMPLQKRGQRECIDDGIASPSSLALCRLAGQRDIWLARGGVVRARIDPSPNFSKEVVRHPEQRRYALIAQPVVDEAAALFG